MTGTNGIGPKLFNLEEVERTCAELNAEYEDFEHTPVSLGEAKPASESVPEPPKDK